MTPPRVVLGSHVYLDSNLYIYLLEGIDVYRRPMVALAAELDRQDVSVIASELLFAELLPRPVRDGRPALVASYLELLQGTPRITLTSVDRNVILRAVHLRADFGLRSMDAMHVATALVHGCETFITNDERLNVGDQIHLLTLRQWATTLPDIT